ncbi:MAG: hypothetical protein QXQ31_07235 [Zestosphaera sp.]|uniref:hypothetical protein n=1 Tax=Metallosphaera sp. TaxID=2020860 RepID=UPI00317843EF
MSEQENKPEETIGQRRFKKLEEKLDTILAKLETANVKKEGDTIKVDKVLPVLNSVWEHIENCPECKADFLEWERSKWGVITSWMSENKKKSRIR